MSCVLVCQVSGGLRRTGFLFMARLATPDVGRKSDG